VSGGTTIDYYTADMVSAQDYAPFGMLMPGRKYSAGNVYRYGFNGKENDNEVKGEGNQIDYGMRIHDPRLGRFLSIDPYTKDYPWNTPYAYAENEPISNIDLDGLEKVKSTMAAAAAGAKQYAEEKKGTANGLLKLVTSTEPYRNLWGYTKDWGKAITGDRAAIKNVNRKTTEVISKTSMSVANGISKPTTFFSTMHTRSSNENVQGFIYYGLQGTELYFASRILESPNQSQNINNGPNNAPVNLPTRLIRVIEEKFASSPTLGAPGATDVFVADATQLKGLNTSSEIAQKLTLVDQKGNLIRGPFRLIEFDAPSEGLAQPFNRGNPGFINGGKTAGGATEYILPNFKVSDLKNVTQKTIQ
jgi:RHS repeat-associated protein